MSRSSWSITARGLRDFLMLGGLVFLVGSGALAQRPQHTPSSPSVQLHEAVLAAERGDATTAYKITQELLSKNPRFEPALRLQGMLFEESGHNAEAAAIYQRALAVTPGDSEIALKLGIMRLVAGNTDEAIKLLTERSKQAPQDGDALYYLAQAYHLKGDNDTALKAIQGSLKADPNNPSVWQKYGELLCSAGENDTALQWLKKAQHADATLQRMDFDLAVASYNNQDLENAVEYATKAVSDRPQDLQSLALLAAIEVKLGQWENGKITFQKILSVRDDDQASLLGLGHCELSLKNYQLAVEPLERVLREDPTMVLAHFYLSRAYAGLGKTAEAGHEAAIHRKLLEDAASPNSNGGNGAEKETRSQAEKLLSDGKEPEAMQLFRERSKGEYATPGSPYLFVGTVYLSMDKAKDAERLLRKALAIEPGVHGAHTFLAILDIQQDNLPQAENELKSELALIPQDPFATAELGVVRYREGRWSEAADLLSKSKTVVPFSLYMLADSYFRLGKVQDADVTAELAASYSRNDSKLKQGIIDLLSRNQQTELAQKLSSR